MNRAEVITKVGGKRTRVHLRLRTCSQGNRPEELSFKLGQLAWAKGHHVRLRCETAAGANARRDAATVKVAGSFVVTKLAEPIVLAPAGDFFEAAR